MLDLLTTASTLIRMPSVNPPGDEGLLVAWLADLMDARGWRPRVVESVAGRPSLVGVLPGAGTRRPRIFTGHLDVVGVGAAEAGRWTTDPFAAAVVGDRLVGRGSVDMKGAIAAILCAADSLDAPPPGDVVVVFTADEENLMSGSKAVAASGLLPPDADVVVGEPTGLRLCTAGRGRTWAHITLSGRTGHGSDPGLVNPIQHAARLVDALAAEDFSTTAASDSGSSFWRPLAIAAGVEPCVVPDLCTLTVDARLAPDHDPDDVWRRLDALLTRLGLPVEVSVEVVDRREGWRTPSASVLISDAVAALDAEGGDTTPGVFGGTTDGTVLRRAGRGHGVRDVVIVGPGDLALAHAADESVAIADLEAAVRLYRRLMLA